MLDVLLKALAFTAVIAMGYILKKKGFFQLKDFYLISKIVVKITLPCAIIYNFSSISMEPSLPVSYTHLDVYKRQGYLPGN